MIIKFKSFANLARNKLLTLKNKYWNRPMNIPVVLLIALFLLVLVWLGINYQALYGKVIIAQQTGKLRKAAQAEPADFQNPMPQYDDFQGEIPSAFWSEVIINFTGTVGAGPAYGVIDLSSNGRELVMRHENDPDFDQKTVEAWAVPGPEKYNNVTLVSKQAFLPTDTHDVVVRFTLRASEDYYGSAGVVMQPVGLLDGEGIFHGPFNLFGLMLMGPESVLEGQAGAVCSISLDWVPVLTKSMDLDIYALNEYELRMSRLSNRNWRVSISVNGKTMCSETMPSLGPVVAHVWSDNYLFSTPKKEWYHLLPPFPVVDFQNGGHKEVYLGPIEIRAESR